MALLVPNITGRALLQGGTCHQAWDWFPPSSLLQLWGPREEKAGVGLGAGELGLSRLWPDGTAGISLLASSEAAECFVWSQSLTGAAWEQALKSPYCKRHTKTQRREPKVKKNISIIKLSRENESLETSVLPSDSLSKALEINCLLGEEHWGWDAHMDQGSRWPREECPGAAGDGYVAWAAAKENRNSPFPSGLPDASPTISPN